MRKNNGCGCILYIVVCGVLVSLLLQVGKVIFILFVLLLFPYFVVKLVNCLFRTNNLSSTENHTIKIAPLEIEKEENSNLSQEELIEYAKMCNVYCEFKERPPTNDSTLNGNFRFNDKRFTEKYNEPYNYNISPDTLHSISNIIVSTYNNFGVYVKINNFNFTKYYAVVETIPLPGTSVKSILAFQSEVSVVLGTEVIINAMYEKGYVGIIIPMDYIDSISDNTESSSHNSINSTATDAERNLNNDDRDSYFAKAGRFIIEKEKASTGMLQRAFNIGFNRALRIMDQLEESGGCWRRRWREATQGTYVYGRVRTVLKRTYLIEKGGGYYEKENCNASACIYNGSLYRLYFFRS